MRFLCGILRREARSSRVPGALTTPPYVLVGDRDDDQPIRDQTRQIIKRFVLGGMRTERQYEPHDGIDAEGEAEQQK